MNRLAHRSKLTQADRYILKTDLIILDSSDRETVTVNAFKTVLRNNHYEIDQETADYLDSLRGDVNYNEMLNKLFYDASTDAWTLGVSLERNQIRQDYGASRYTNTTQNFMHNEFSPAHRKPRRTIERKSSKEYLNEADEHYRKLVDQLQRSGVDYRNLYSLQTAFNMADIKGLGQVTPTELRNALKQQKNRLPSVAEEELLEGLVDEEGLISGDNVQKLITIYKYSRTNGDIYEGRGRSCDAAAVLRPLQAQAAVPRPRFLDEIYERLNMRYRRFIDCFTHFDPRKTGAISKDMFGCGVQALGMFVQSSDLERIFTHLDKGEKGFIDYNDFTAMKDEPEPLSPIKARSGLTRIAASPGYSNAELRSSYSGHGSIHSGRSDIPRHFNLDVTYGKPVQKAPAMSDILSNHFQKESIELRNQRVNERQTIDSQDAARWQSKAAFSKTKNLKRKQNTMRTSMPETFARKQGIKSTRNTKFPRI